MGGYPVSAAFWSASTSWYASRKAAQDKSTRAGAAPSLSRKEAQWRSNGRRYLRGRADLASRAALVRVDPRLTARILEFLDAMAPAVVSAMDAEVGRLAFEAWRDWPVASGLSKSLIGLEYFLDGDQFIGQVVNTAPYVFFIKGQPHRKLLERRGLEVAQRIAARVSSQLDRVAP